MLKKITSYGLVILVAMMMALNYQLFVFPNRFAPAGLNGIFTMLQHLFGFKLSYTSIILNIPLSIVAFFTLSRPQALRSLTYILAFSGFLMILDHMDLSAFVYSTTISTLVGPAVAGLITGFGGYVMHQLGACYGGTEYIAGFIHKRYPNFNFFNVIFVLNCSVAVLSYFVYDYKVEPVLLCILYSYFSSSVRNHMNQKYMSAVRCEIITENPEELSNAIIHQLHHTATRFAAQGIYTGAERTVLICIVNLSQLSELTKLVTAYPGSFVTVSPVSRVLGNFKRLDSHSQPEKVLFDSGSAGNK